MSILHREYLVALPLAAVAWLTTGCADTGVAREDVATALERYRQEYALSAEAPTVAAREVGSAATRPATRPARRAVPDSADLGYYVTTALQRNPEIIAARREAESKVERIAQVTALPDPQLKTRILGEPVRTAAGDIYFQLDISQMFPVPEKLDARGKIALEEVRMSVQNMRAVYIRVAADVKKFYYRMYFADEAITVTEESSRLLRQILRIAESKLRAGRAPQQDVLRASVELSNLENELIVFRQMRQTAEAGLNQLMDQPVGTPLPKPKDFDLVKLDVQLAELLARAVEHNPDLKKLTHQIQRDRHKLWRARLAYWPEVTLGFSWTYLDPRGAFEPPRNPQTGLRPMTPQLSERGTDSWAITAGVNLPIWFYKIEAGIAEARKNINKSISQYAARRNRVSFQIEDALVRVRAQQQLVELFDTTIIPQAQQTLDVSRESYAAGTVDFLTLVDNWRKLLDFRLLYYRSLSQLEQDFAELERAVGQPIRRPQRAAK